MISASIAGLCDRVLVMYAGRVVEAGAGARHLQDRRSIPIRPGCCARCRGSTRRSVQRLTTIPGQPPNLQRLPPGCAFQRPLRPPCSSSARPQRPPLATFAPGRMQGMPSAGISEQRAAALGRRISRFISASAAAGCRAARRAIAEGRRRRQLRSAARRDARPGRRIRLRQDRRSAAPCCACCPNIDGPRRLARPRISPSSSREAMRLKRAARCRSSSRTRSPRSTRA